MSQNDWIDRLRERVDIVEIISEYTPLRRAGRDWRGACPLHGGTKKGNFVVSPERGTYHCFSDCNGGGDVFKFLMEMTGMEFMPVARMLAARYGIHVPQFRPRNLSAAERERAAAMGDFTGNGQGSGWSRLGIENAVAVFQLGVRDGSEEHLLLPVWGKEDLSVPGGWLSYRVDAAGVPQALGFDPASRAGLDGSLFLPQGAVAHSRDHVMLFSVDPLVAIRIWESGYRSVFSVAGTCRTPDEPWIPSSALDHLLERTQGRLDRIALLVPGTSGDKEEHARLQRALYATEVALLERGIEPLWIDLPTHEPESMFGWLWASIQDGEKDIQSFLSSSDRVLDVFELRVALLAPRVARKTMDAAVAVEKLLPSLRSARSRDRLLFESYLAWASRWLRVDRFYLLGAVEGIASEGWTESF